jgi:hypothetical protein
MHDNRVKTSMHVEVSAITYTIEAMHGDPVSLPEESLPAKDDSNMHVVAVSDLEVDLPAQSFAAKNSRSSEAIRSSESVQHATSGVMQDLRGNPTSSWNHAGKKPGRKPDLHSSRDSDKTLMDMQDQDKQGLHAERTQKIIDFCKIPRNREEIQTHIGLHNRDYFRKEILVPLLKNGQLVATIPDKPNSPKQQYRTT